MGKVCRLQNVRLGMAGVAAALMITTFSVVATAGPPLGVALDDEADAAKIFDTRTGSLVTTVPLGSGSVGDCVVQKDESLAYVTDFASHLWVIDLAASPPALATGINPIALSSPGTDVELSPDGEYLVTCGGGDFVSVIDVASRLEIDTFDLDHGCQSVEVCSDGSVLVGFFSIVPTKAINRRLLLDGNGQLSDTGDLLNTDLPTNLHCAPDASTGLALQLGGDVTSFSIPGLNSLDQFFLGPAAATARFDPTGETVFIRFEDLLTAFAYDGATGTFGAEPLFSVEGAGDFVPLGGVDTLALDVARDQLFVPTGDSVRVFSSRDGLEGAPIPMPAARLSGVCIAPSVEVFSDGFESGATDAWSSTFP